MVDFFRKIDASTDASDIIDTEVNLHYSDLFNGGTATVDIQSENSIGYYFINSKLADKPQYGDAEVTGLRAFLFLTDMDITESYASPSILAYKSKKVLSNEGTITEQAAGRDILTFSTKMNGKRHLLETFDNVDDTATTVSRIGTQVKYTTGHFLDAQWAFNNMDNKYTSPKNTSDFDSFFAHYGEYFQGVKVVKIQQKPGTLTSGIQWVKNSLPLWGWGPGDEDPNVYFPVIGSGGSTDPIWKMESDDSNIQSSVTVVEDTEMSSEAIPITSSNSIFTYFHGSENDKIIIDDAGTEFQNMYSRATISKAESKTGGHSLKLKNFWSKDEGHSFYGRRDFWHGWLGIENDVSGYVTDFLRQSCGVTFTDIPMPIQNEVHKPGYSWGEQKFGSPNYLNSSYNEDNAVEGEDHFSTGSVPGKIVIIFKVKDIPYARQYWVPELNTFIGKVKPWMHSLDRSFGFYFSEFVPMKKGLGRSSESYAEDGGPYSNLLEYSLSSDTPDFTSFMMNTYRPRLGGTQKGGDHNFMPLSNSNLRSDTGLSPMTQHCGMFFMKCDETGTAETESGHMASKSKDLRCVITDEHDTFGIPMNNGYYQALLPQTRGADMSAKDTTLNDTSMEDGGDWSVGFGDILAPYVSSITVTSGSQFQPGDIIGVPGKKTVMSWQGGQWITIEQDFWERMTIVTVDENILTVYRPMVIGLNQNEVQHFDGSVVEFLGNNDVSNIFTGNASYTQAMVGVDKDEWDATDVPMDTWLRLTFAFERSSPKIKVFLQEGTSEEFIIDGAEMSFNHQDSETNFIQEWDTVGNYWTHMPNLTIVSNNYAGYGNSNGGLMDGNYSEEQVDTESNIYIDSVELLDWGYDSNNTTVDMSKVHSVNKLDIDNATNQTFHQRDLSVERNSYGAVTDIVSSLERKEINLPTYLSFGSTASATLGDATGSSAVYRYLFFNDFNQSDKTNTDTIANSNITLSYTRTTATSRLIPLPTAAFPISSEDHLNRTDILYAYPLANNFNNVYEWTPYAYQNTAKTSGPTFSAAIHYDDYNLAGYGQQYYQTWDTDGSTNDIGIAAGTANFTITGNNYIENFKQKGIARIKVSDALWSSRENIYTSSRLVKCMDVSSGRLKFDSLDWLKRESSDTYRMFLYGSEGRPHNVRWHLNAKANISNDDVILFYDTYDTEYAIWFDTTGAETIPAAAAAADVQIEADISGVTTANGVRGVVLAAINASSFYSGTHGRLTNSVSHTDAFYILHVRKGWVKDTRVLSPESDPADIPITGIKTYCLGRDSYIDVSLDRHNISNEDKGIITLGFDISKSRLRWGREIVGNWSPDVTKNLVGSTYEYIWPEKTVIDGVYNKDRCITMISPKKYWVFIKVDTKDSLKQNLPSRTYGAVNVLSAAPGVGDIGATYNEFKFTDGAYSNRWLPSRSEAGRTSALELTKDYGFGANDKDNINLGYIDNPSVEISNPLGPDGASGKIYHNEFVLDKMVEVDNAEVGDVIGLMFTPSDDNWSSSYTVATTEHGTSSYRPYFLTKFTDEKPIIENFLVLPDENDPFYPKYTWSVAADDLWYGFLLISDNTISNQYHNVVAHVPLNDSRLDLDDNKVYLYDEKNNTNQTAQEYTMPDFTHEGLAGSGLHFNGSSDYLAWNYNSFEVISTNNNQTTDSRQFSILAHFILDNSPGADEYIVHQYGAYSIYVDSNNFIHASVTPAKISDNTTGTTVTLKSTSVADVDGETPVNVILTFDGEINTGNIKLFINGKLEDQSGVLDIDVNSTGSSNNLAISYNSLYYGSATANRFVIGANTSNGTSFSNEFDGRIEEVCLYKDVIYPLVPSTGEITISNKPTAELSNASKATGKSVVSRLVIKDYHNIRGKSNADVAITSPVAFRKSGIGLETNNPV